jgi:hypothetical protein
VEAEEEEEEIKDGSHLECKMEATVRVEEEDQEEIKVEGDTEGAVKIEVTVMATGTVGTEIGLNNKDGNHVEGMMHHHLNECDPEVHPGGRGIDHHLLGVDHLVHPQDVDLRRLGVEIPLRSDEETIRPREDDVLKILLLQREVGIKRTTIHRPENQLGKILLPPEREGTILLHPAPEYATKTRPLDVVGMIHPLVVLEPETIPGPDPDPGHHPSLLLVIDYAGVQVEAGVGLGRHHPRAGDEGALPRLLPDLRTKRWPKQMAKR